jgi:hypothetical protein
VSETTITTTVNSIEEIELYSNTIHVTVQGGDGAASATPVDTGDADSAITYLADNVGEDNPPYEVTQVLG